MREDASRTVTRRWLTAGPTALRRTNREHLTTTHAGKAVMRRGGPALPERVGVQIGARRMINTGHVWKAEVARLATMSNARVLGHVSKDQASVPDLKFV